MKRWIKPPSALDKAGFTILEVMIYLAITGGILAVTVASFSGQQEKTEFRQSVNGFRIDMQDIMNDISTGFYPSNSDFSCKTIPATVPFDISFDNTGSPQGTNSGCVFLGKIIELSLANATNYDTYTLVGSSRAAAPSQSVLKLLGTGGNPGVRDSKTLGVDLQIAKVVSRTDPANTVKGIAIISENAQLDGLNQAKSGNASRVKIYEYGGDFNGTVNWGNLREAQQGVFLCLQQPGAFGNKVAVSIGIEGQMSLDRDIGWPPECGS